MRKMVQIAPSVLEAIDILQADTGKSFQDLMEEAIADLLKKHRQPVGMKQMFDDSLAHSRRSRKKAD